MSLDTTNIKRNDVPLKANPVAVIKRRREFPQQLARYAYSTHFGSSK